SRPSGAATASAPPERSGRPVGIFHERRTAVIRQFLIPSVGAITLLTVMSAPGQLYAQRVRAGLPPSPPPTNRMMINQVTPRNSAVFTPQINRSFFTPRFSRNHFFGSRFNPRFNPAFNPGFNGFSNNGFFNPAFNSAVSGGFFNPFNNAFSGSF